MALLMSLGASARDVEQDLQQWSVSSHLSYSIAGHEESKAEVTELVTKLVSGEYTLENGEYHVPHGCLQSVADDLLERGILVGNGMRGVALTKGSLQKLVAHWAVSDPKPVCALRDGAELHALTMYELLLKLEAFGFVWKRWPTSRAAREKLESYAPGREAIWYSTHALPPKTYFLALLKAQDGCAFIWGSVLGAFWVYETPRSSCPLT